MEITPITFAFSIFFTDYDYTNDSPDILPKVQYSRYKSGADVLIKCPGHHLQDVTWQFKRCQTSFRGVQCDKKHMYRVDNDWKHLDFGRKNKLEIRNATEENAGLYRCFYNNSIKKIYIVDIYVPVKYEGTSPKVVSLLPSSNGTVLPNAQLTIQCKVASVLPPEIRWLKECNGLRCELPVDGHCFCPIPLNNSVYSPSIDVYISKLTINNARYIDSGLYSCLVISMYGKDYKNVTVKVENSQDLRDLYRLEESRKSFSLLFVIPLCFVLVPVSIWLCFNGRNKKKNCQRLKEQKKLIGPVVEVDVVNV